MSMMTPRRYTPLAAMIADANWRRRLIAMAEAKRDYVERLERDERLAKLRRS